MPSNLDNTEACKCEAMVKCLEMQWQDHFQTRAQTWKSLQMDAVLAVALLGIDWRLQSTSATTIAAILLIVAALFGALITRHHRKVEILKLTAVQTLETMLGVPAYGQFTPPEHNQLLDVVRFNKSNTSLFILRTHIIFMIFGIVYVIFTLLNGHHMRA